ncbi:hypothetical protein QFC21_006355 [Naganishia friedmannii]|uniref:Uncharacterized protein n=1 Tax=Naganishia friedmannii TaxID=89922 RepID=A0ACC2V3D6_9TREE|nr:hypothetical protein QFC21_006355 [Naganishia friedmannii]
MRQSTSSILALAVVGAVKVGAHQGCGGQEIAKRNLGMMDVGVEGLYVADGSTDAPTECAYYSYPPVTAAKSQFPTIWEIASLVPGDAEAAAVFAQVQAKVNATVGAVRMKGTPNGDFSAFTPTYNASDTDCWWTYKECQSPPSPPTSFVVLLTDSATQRPTGTTPKHPNLPADIIDLPEPRSLGIGFDDGPNCSHNAFYGFLRANEQQATMFYIGSNVMDWPLQAQDAIADGHQIAIHTWSHNYMTALTTEQAFAELWYTRKAIQLVTGVTPLSWRPPFGDIDDRIRTIAQALNLTSILWQSDSDDWRINTGTPPVTSAQIDANYQNLINGVNNGTYDKRGTIMLTHELNNFTMSEAIKWYPMLKAAFGKLVPIASAYNLTHPYAEGNISYPDFGGNSAAAVSSSTSVSASASGTGASATGTMKTSVAAGSGTAASSAGSAQPTPTAARAKSAAFKSSASTTQLMGTIVGGFAVLSWFC